MLVSGRILKLIIIPLTVFSVFFAPYLRDIVLVYLQVKPTPSQLVSRPDANTYPIPEVHVPRPQSDDRDIEQDRKKQKIFASHNWRTDGLVEVNPDGSHPILELISRANEQWELKLRRASKSLYQAVAEYKRRYHRAPPKGFDDWWNYVQRHNVQLPDEYDQIHQDLQPFWGISPKDLQSIQSQLEAHGDSFTLGKTDDSIISVVNHTFTTQGHDTEYLARAGILIDLLEEVEHLLPAFRAVFSPHDVPNRLSDHAVKEMAVEAAERNRHIDLTTLPPMNKLGWVSACPPTSPARLAPINLDSPPSPRSHKTFIHSHSPTMDPCLHPTLFHHHGQFLSHNYGPTPQRHLVPEFSFCSTHVHHDIKFPSPVSFDEVDSEHDDKRKDERVWNAKIDERLLWRGSNTGMRHGESTRWKTSQRIRLVEWAKELNGTVDVLMSKPDSLSSSSEKFSPMQEAALVRYRKARLNPALLDISFAGSPLQCSPEVCKELDKMFEWKRRMTSKEAAGYKYVIDVDGNGWSSRFKRLITSNAVIFKSTIYPEWFTDRIAPWVHYVPIQVDLSDLYDSLIFFRGDPNGEGAHEDLARSIAVEGRRWSKRFWRREDMIAYFFRLLLEYARVTSLDRDAMSYKPGQRDVGDDK